MKKIKNIIYIAILSLLVVSCEDNTESVTNPGEYNGSSLTEVKVSFIDDATEKVVVEGAVTSLKIGMPNIVNGEVKITINVKSSDGEAEVNYPSTITLLEGQVATYFDVTPTDDGVAETEVFTVEITNVEVNLNTNQEYFVHIGDSSRTLNIIEPTITTTAGDLTFDFNWSGVNDLDIRLYNSSGNLIDQGIVWSTASGESVDLAGATPDGDYVMEVWPWTVNDASIDYTYDIIAPTETITYTGTFTNLIGSWNGPFTSLEIKKVTSGATVYYVINQL